MEVAKIFTSLLLLHLGLFSPCLSAAISSNSSSHPSMSKGPFHPDYVERHCRSVLSSAAELRADADRAAVLNLKYQLSFANGDWSQDAGQAPMFSFHGSYAYAAVAGPESTEAVPLASFMVTDMDMAPRRGARTTFNVSGILSFTVARNSMEPHASPEFELRPGVVRLLVQFRGVYTETKSSGSGDDGGGDGERVLCMVGDIVLPVPCNDSMDTWDWTKNRGGGSNFKPPVVADGNILLVLRYPKTTTLTTRAVRGEMMSASAKSDAAYFDTVRLVSQLAGGYDTGYQFQPDLDAVARCGNDPLFHDGDAMEDPINASLCYIFYQSAPGNKVMEVIGSWDCKGTDAFCSRVGPFETSRPATSAKEDMAFPRSAAIAVQGLRCEPTSNTDRTAAKRVAAVFRYVPPWVDQPTAAKRTGLSGTTLSAEGVWIASTGRACMVACLGVGNESCRYRVTLSVRTTFSMTRRSIIVGQITAVDGSHAPLSFQQRVNPRSSASLRMSYVYTKVEQARELLRRSEPTGFRDNFVAKSLLSYPNIAGAADDMVSLSSLGDNLNLRFCVVKPPFVPEWMMEETVFELQILSNWHDPRRKLLSPISG